MPHLKKLLAFLPLFLLTLLCTFHFKTSLYDSLVILIWPCLISLLGWSFWGVLIPSFSKLEKPPLDLGAGISKSLALLIIFLFIWFFSYAGIPLYTKWGILFVVFTFCSINLKKLKLNLKKQKYFWEIEGVFFWLYCLFLFQASFHPEIYWAEKPMDFSILNFMRRTGEHPIQDPWAYGQAMHYYYFGYYIWGGISKLFNPSMALGYHLSLSSLPALMGCACFSLFLWILKSKRLAIAGVVIFMGSSNMATLTQWLSGKILSMDFFWNSTRVFQKNFFAEFPNWSFLHGDLHPHVMAYPYGITFMFLMIPFIQRQDLLKFKKWNYLLLLAFVWGSFLALNAWDFILLGLLFGLILTFSSNSWRVFCKRFSWGMGIACMSLLVFLPFFLILKTGNPLYFKLTKALNDLSQIYAHQGHWWVLLLVLWGGVGFYQSRRKEGLSNETLKISLCFLLSSMAFYILVERVIFMDQVNTIFKAYTNIWIWMGISTITLLRFLPILWRSSLIGRLFISLKGILFGFLIAGSLFNFFAVKSYYPWKGERPSLAGQDYLKNMDRGYLKIVNWINENISGAPLIVESYGRSFDQNVARISMHTGLPSYLGWRNHVQIRGVSHSEVIKRSQDIDYIYNSTDPLKVYEFLREKGVKLILVGSTEWEKFEQKGLAKFEAYSKLFPLLIKERGVALYAVGDGGI